MRPLGLASIIAGMLAAGSAHAAVPRRVEVAKGPIAGAIDRQLTDAAGTRGFGGAVVIAIKGEVILQGGWGYGDRAANTPFTADTSAQIGSITKSFTGLAASQLAAQGKLDLKVPVRTYLKDAREPAGSASLDQLMTHTAGLDDYCGDDFDRRTKTELIGVCMARPLAHARGTYAYSNMGFSMAAAAIEAASGQRWEDYLRDHVWRPFGMTHSGWTDFGEAPRSQFAVGYDKDAPQGVISDRIAALKGADWNLKGNGGIQASAADMYRYYQGIMAQPQAVRDLMLSPHAQEEPEVLAGYGLAFRTDGGKVFRIGHAGSDGVFFAYLAVYPQQDAFFYFVGNNGEGPVKAELQGALKTLQTAIGAGPKPKS